MVERDLASGGAWAGYLILGLPLLSFLVNGLWAGRRHARASGWIAAALMGSTAALCLAFLGLGPVREALARPGGPDPAVLLFDRLWLDFGGGLEARFGFLLDPISVMMLMAVSVVSFLVHLYSIGYMKDDPAAGRFFPLLSFFTFAMLGLVASSNLIQTFFFWELVGVASYLLIGFWYARPAAVAAAKKAFIMTRFADAFFLIGVLLAGVLGGGFDFLHLNGPVAAANLDRPLALGLFQVNLLGLSTLLIYAGAWGKSAMFPLHGWLPDAMEGPTPVSSLIHSATMVVAGVYLTARLFPLFSAAESTLGLVELTGAFTAVFAAAIACTQTDLKRILAYSTLSQLGLMMAALGTSAYSASMFHVFTHAFFKCLLFLSAGVVIHAIHNQDIRAAGGLRKALPWTYAATLIAVLAIAGIPPFSGFFSKEEILGAAWAGRHYGAFCAGLLTGGLTAFYMTRYLLLVFHGPRGGTHREEPHGPGHESPVMLIPILVLAVPSAVVGWLARPAFLDEVIPLLPAAAPAGGHGHIAWLPFAATGLAALGMAAAWFLYGKSGRAVGYPEGREPVWFRLLQRRFHIDELYVWLAKDAVGKAVAAPSNWFERHVINGGFDALAWFLRRCGGVIVRLQNGQLQLYMALALIGLYVLFRATRGFPG
jgi:NADH-quinone oxidoreductase subunit L